MFTFSLPTWQVMQKTMSGPLGHRLRRDALFTERSPNQLPSSNNDERDGGGGGGESEGEGVKSNMVRAKQTTAAATLALHDGMERPFIPFDGPPAPTAAEAVRKAAESADGFDCTPLLDKMHGPLFLRAVGMPLWRQILWEGTLIDQGVSEEVSNLVSSQLDQHHGWEGGQPPKNHVLDTTKDNGTRASHMIS